MNYKLIYIIIFLSLYTGCSKDSKIPEREFRLYSVFPEENHENSTHRTFIVYDMNTGETIHHLLYKDKDISTTLKLQDGEYNLIGIEGVEVPSNEVSNFNTATINYSPDGSSPYYYSKQNIIINKEGATFARCLFTFLSGALTIGQNDEPLQPGQNAYFTLRIERPNGKRFFLKDQTVSPEESIITSQPIYFVKHSNGQYSIPEYYVFLFPNEADTPITLTITFYTKDHQITDAWTMTQPLPIASGMITGGKINFSAYSQYPVGVTVEQVPFEQTIVDVDATHSE